MNSNENSSAGTDPPFSAPSVFEREQTEPIEFVPPAPPVYVRFLGTSSVPVTDDAMNAIHDKPAGIKRNPRDWRYMLAKYLLGGEIEAVPLLPNRPIFPTETVRVRLGQPGALNTAEVKQVVHQTTQLLTIEDPIHDMYPKTFVVLDIIGTDGRLYPVLGTFQGWMREDGMKKGLIETRSGETYAFPAADIKNAYYAPAGYQL